VRVLIGLWVAAALALGGLAIAAVVEDSRPGPVQINVFLTDDATEEQRVALERALRAIDGVQKVTLVSKEAAFAEFRELYKDQPEVWENISADVLPSSFKIDGVGDDLLQRVRSVTSPLRGVEEVVSTSPAEGPPPEAFVDMFNVPRATPSPLERARNGVAIGAPALLIPITALTLFMTMKRKRRPCPECAEPMRVEARKCPHCGSDVGAPPGS
jgi:hypothetical protein